MADEIVIKIVLDTRDIQRAAQAIQTQLNSTLNTGSEGFKGLNADIDASTAGINTLRSAVGLLGTEFAALGAVAILKDIASRALDAGIAIDRQVNSLKALTGSAEAARQRFQELFKLAQQTPGL